MNSVFVVGFLILFSPSSIVGSARRSETEGYNLMPTDNQQMSDVYAALDKNDVWNKMETWEKPVDPQSKENKPSAENLIDLPEDLESLQLNQFHGRFVKDAVRYCEIYAVDFNATTNIKTVSVGIGRISLNANTCGLGICFIHEYQDSHHRLILVQKLSSIDIHQLRLVRFSMHVSIKQVVNVELNPGRFEGNDNVLYEEIPSFVLTYAQNDVTFDPDANGIFNIVTQVTTEFGNVQDSSMSAFIETGDELTSGIPTRKMITSENEANYTAILDLSAANNGVLMTNMILNSRGGSRTLSMFIYLQRLYFVYPNNEDLPRPLMEMALICGRNQLNVTVGDVFEIGCWIYNPGVAPSVKWYKKTGADLQPVTGFEVQYYPMPYITATSMKSYSLSQQDAGEYIVVATLPDANPIMSRNFSYTVNIFEEHVWVKMTRRTVNNTVVITCASTGKPRPEIMFFEMPSYGMSISERQRERLITGSNVMQVGEVDTTDQFTRKELVLLSFPKPTRHEEGLMVIKCVASNGYETRKDYAYINEYEFSLL